MSSTSQLCTFQVDDLEIGIDVAAVQEVLKTQHVTQVPLADPTVAGLVNLRGQIVTAIDLRVCLQRPACERNESLSLIIRHGAALVCLLIEWVK
jgi:purine-binding chemotaxis protein CheW